MTRDAERAYVQRWAETGQLLDALHEQGVDQARLYGADDGVYGGLNAFFLLVDEPEAFLHPPLTRKLGRRLTQLAAERNAISALLRRPVQTNDAAAATAPASVRWNPRGTPRKTGTAGSTSTAPSVLGSRTEVLASCLSVPEPDRGRSTARARPEAKANPRSPSSIAASAPSSAVRVGLAERLYS